MSLFVDVRIKLINLAFLGFHHLISVSQQLKSDFQLCPVRDSNGSSTTIRTVTGSL